MFRIATFSNFNPLTQLSFSHFILRSFLFPCRSTIWPINQSIKLCFENMKFKTMELMQLNSDMDMFKKQIRAAENIINVVTKNQFNPEHASK